MNDKTKGFVCTLARADFALSYFLWSWSCGTTLEEIIKLITYGTEPTQSS